jgi:hypothetical protein
VKTSSRAGGLRKVGFLALVTSGCAALNNKGLTLIIRLRMEPTLHLQDSRPMPGASSLSGRPGAWIDATSSGIEPEDATVAWRTAVRAMLGAIGWDREECLARTFRGGVSLLLTAPEDLLGVATEASEWGFVQAQKAHGVPVDERLVRSDLPLDIEARLLSSRIAAERRQGLMALAEMAAGQGVSLLLDENAVSLGHGARSMSFAPESLPEPDQVPWATLGDVKVCLVTGPNAGTAVARLVARIAHEAGLVPGVAEAGGATGGAAAARAVLRDHRTQIAVLEATAAGILREGLPVRRADVAVITDLAELPSGELGLMDLRDLAETSFATARSIGGGRLVLDADDAILHARGKTLAKPLLWVSRDAGHPTVRRHVEAGGDACYLEDDKVVLASKKRVHELTAGGMAPGDPGGVLCAAGAAFALGLSPRAIAAGLRGP